MRSTANASVQAIFGGTSTSPSRIYNVQLNGKTNHPPEGHIRKDNPAIEQPDGHRIHRTKQANPTHESHIEERKRPKTQSNPDSPVPINSLLSPSKENICT